MAKLENMTFSVKFKNVREIKKATKAVKKLADALSKTNDAAIKAAAAMKDFGESLPFLEEIEGEK